MKLLSLSVFFIIVSQYVYAEGSEDFIGKFKGTEKSVITCENSSWNKSESRNWQTTHSDLNDNTYKILTKVAGGTYKGEGTIAGGSATGTFKGKDGFGNSCSGEFTDTINGDELKATISGSCPSVKCDFTGDVTAKRQ